MILIINYNIVLEENMASLNDVATGMKVIINEYRSKESTK